MSVNSSTHLSVQTKVLSEGFCFENMQNQHFHVTTFSDPLSIHSTEYVYPTISLLNVHLYLFQPIKLVNIIELYPNFVHGLMLMMAFYGFFGEQICLALKQHVSTVNPSPAT